MDVKKSNNILFKDMNTLLLLVLLVSCVAYAAGERMFWWPPLVVRPAEKQSASKEKNNGRGLHNKYLHLLHLCKLSYASRLAVGRNDFRPG